MAKNSKKTDIKNTQKNNNVQKPKADKVIDKKEKLVDDKKDIIKKEITNKENKNNEKKEVVNKKVENNEKKDITKSTSTKKNGNSKNSKPKSNVPNKKTVVKDEKKEIINKEKSKEEEIVFKDVKTSKKTLSKPQGIDSSNKNNTSSKNQIKKDNVNTSSNNKKENVNKSKTTQNESKKNIEKKKVDKKTEKVEDGVSTNKEDVKKVNNINTEEFFEEKKKKNRKVALVVFITFIILLIILCFSTVFAIIGSFKTTIARGVKINGVDLSNLTYEEARIKMEEVIAVQSLPEIDLICGEYQYTVSLEDISYEYDLTTALNIAYNVGKDGNIIKNNYTLMKSAVFGEDIKMTVSYDQEALNAIIDIVDTNIPGRVKQYSHYIDGTNLIITPGIDGIKINNEELKENIITSIENRKYNNILENYNNIQLEIPYKNVETDKIDAQKISTEIFAEPQNAYYVEATETTDFEIYPAKDGVSLAISVEEAQSIIDSEIKEEYVIPLTITPAEIQLNDIGIEAFPYKIQSFSTSYDASNYSRSKNLEIAASKINGTVLMPGEIFSFNNVVGERTVAEGYRNAKIYSNGQVVDGLAGGICQISSTLYNVVLLSNLEIVERFNHSFTTTYVAAGRDATVVYGIKDFKFKNSRNYPIKIEASVSNGIATFSIYGIKEENEYTVKIIPKTTQTIPYSTQTIIDSTLAPGTMKVTQAGASGKKVTTYKEVYLNGSLMSSEVISNDVYQVMSRIVRANPAVETVAPESAPATNP